MSPLRSSWSGYSITTCIVTTDAPAVSGIQPMGVPGAEARINLKVPPYLELEEVVVTGGAVAVGLIVAVVVGAVVIDVGLAVVVVLVGGCVVVEAGVPQAVIKTHANRITKKTIVFFIPNFLLGYFGLLFSV